MPHPPVTVTHHPNHLLVTGTWIDYGERDRHEPSYVPWTLVLPTLRHRDHLAHVLLHPGVEPAFDPGGLETNGVEDARALMHLNWWEGTYNERCELQTTAEVCLEQQPYTGVVTLYGWLESHERLGLARFAPVEAVELAEQLRRADAAALPDGELVVGAPWFPDADQLRKQRDASGINDRHRDQDQTDDSPGEQPWTDPWETPPRAGGQQHIS